MAPGFAPLQSSVTSCPLECHLSLSLGRRTLLASFSPITQRTASVARKEISFRWKPIFTVVEAQLLIT